jgi:hypothetical protein
MPLRNEVEKFKNWASAYPVQERSGEWEDDYPDWSGFHEAAIEFLASSSPDEWDEEDISDLLYAIARDNEVEYLAQEVAKNIDTLLKLSELAIGSPERDAKWQLAAQLGGLSSRKQEAEAALLKLVDDQNEYVSRRALLSLGLLKSSKVEELAERAWKTGDEYQRIAALWVLKDVTSSKLPAYLEEALTDGRQYLVHNANEVQKA